LEEQDQWWLSLAADPAPSWKSQHPADEEQKTVQWTLQDKAQEIASRQQSLMDWLTPLYAAKVPTAVADKLAAEQKSPAIVADRPVAEQKNLTVVENNLIVEEEVPATSKRNPSVEEEGLAIAEEILAAAEEDPTTLEESPVAETEGPTHMELI
jgi:hypothetical protein